MELGSEESVLIFPIEGSVREVPLQRISGLHDMFSIIICTVSQSLPITRLQRSTNASTRRSRRIAAGKLSVKRVYMRMGEYARIIRKYRPIFEL
jgi:hypothetical protein